MGRVSSASLHAYAEWLLLQAIRGVLLAAAVGIGAASVRNVTAALEAAAYGHPHGRFAPPPADPSCGFLRQRAGCAASPPVPAAPRQAEVRNKRVEVSKG